MDNLPAAKGYATPAKIDFCSLNRAAQLPLTPGNGSSQVTTIRDGEGFTVTLDDIMQFHLHRAMAAYHRAGGSAFPAESLSDICIFKGRHYVRLANAVEALAVYRIRQGYYDQKYDCWRHQLKRLKRWPKALQTAPMPTSCF